MPTGTIKAWLPERGFGFIRPADGSDDIFFHVSQLKEGDAIERGKQVSYELGTNPRTGKTNAISVDLVTTKAPTRTNAAADVI